MWQDKKTQLATATQAAPTTQTVTTTQRVAKAQPASATQIVTDKCDVTITTNKHCHLTLNRVVQM